MLAGQVPLRSQSSAQAAPERRLHACMCSLPDYGQAWPKGGPPATCNASLDDSGFHGLLSICKAVTLCANMTASFMLRYVLLETCSLTSLTSAACSWLAWPLFSVVAPPLMVLGMWLPMHDQHGHLEGRPTVLPRHSWAQHTQPHMSNPW